MTNKDFELIGQLTEVAMTVAELKAENKILKDINEKLMQALRIHDVVGRSEQLCPDCGNTGRRLPQTLESPDGQECECGA